MRCLNTNELVTSKVSDMYKTQEIVPLKGVYNLEGSQFMHRHINSQLPPTFNNSKNFTDVYPYNTSQTKIRLFALPKAPSNSSAKMLQWIAIQIWSKVPSEIKYKHKPCLTFVSADYKRIVLLGY